MLIGFLTGIVIVILLFFSFYVGFYLGFNKPEVNLFDKIHDYIDDIKPQKDDEIKQVETADGKSKDARHFF